MLSTLPAYSGTEWDIVEPGTCPSQLVPQGGARFAYGQGTSFAAPIVSGIAALTWQVEPRLASEQVAEVLIRSARQTVGRGWNQYTGAGVVDGKAATALARAYDVTSPRAKGKAHRSGGTRDDRGEEGQGPQRVRPGAGRARDLRAARLARRRQELQRGGQRAPRRFHRAVQLKGSKANVFVATACDGNGNCGVKRLGRFRR